MIEARILLFPLSFCHPVVIIDAAPPRARVPLSYSVVFFFFYLTELVVKVN